MDALDQLSERATCGLCGRLIRYSDDFCVECRRAARAGEPLEAPRKTSAAA